jgi:hypothetical protein
MVPPGIFDNPTARSAGARSLAVTQKIYRNSMGQSAGDDYTFDPARKTISRGAGFPSSADDLVVAHYEY